MFDYLVLSSTHLSLFVQFVTGILGFQGMFTPLSDEHKVLRSILILETIVQVIEFCFYLGFVIRFNLETMAATRYFDWIFTTPTMLFTSMLYFTYESERERNNSKNLTIKTFIENNKKTISIVLISNLCMLIFGYLGEIGVIPKLTSLIIGFIFFGISFSSMYINFARYSKHGKIMFWFLLVIWALYGVAFMLPIDMKNIMFNSLDIIAKNFFGVFLWYIIFKKGCWNKEQCIKK